MINYFISALITIFYLEKSSKEVEEKTNRASWPRTIIYLFLTIVFAVFYYKSFQVATIINKVEICSLRGAEDSLHHSKDTIETLSLFNSFKSLGSYRNPYFDMLEADTNNIAKGGVKIAFRASNSSVENIQNRSCFTEEKKKEIEELTGKPIEPSTGSIYDSRYISTSIQSLIPLFPILRYDKPVVKNEPLVSSIEYIGNIKDTDKYKGKVLISKSNPEKGEFIDALSYQQTKVAHFKDVQLEDMVMPHHLANTINIFTAADLSQYTYCIELNSDMYINNLSVSYNVPIEISNQPEGLILSANGFDIVDSDLINKSIGNGPMMILVKLPTMANLQEIRSVILTALLTALLSLFCTNLFFRLRKGAVGFISKRKINISERVKQNESGISNFRFLMYTIFFIITTILLIVVSLSAIGFSFLFETDDWIYLTLKFLLAFVITIVIIYYLHKEIITHKKKKGGK